MGVVVVAMMMEVVVAVVVVMIRMIGMPFLAARSLAVLAGLPRLAMGHFLDLISMTVISSMVMHRMRYAATPIILPRCSPLNMLMP